MNKPTIFFSHSSLDRGFLTVIREKILQKTSKTIEIFMSSDGGSIPFGNNWVHKIEENLEKAKIMLVFISPNSIRSNWIYFESGFSYSKGIKVIPIGINGINVGELKPPINLLQGFNITSYEGLNNIVSIINKEFSCEYPTNFLPEDYQEIVNVGGFQSDMYFRHSDDVDYFAFEYINKMNSGGVQILLTCDTLKCIEGCLVKAGEKYVKSGEKEIHMHGMVFKMNQVDQDNISIGVKIDPYIFAAKATLLLMIMDNIYKPNTFDKYFFNIVFNDSVKMISKDYKLSSRLYENGLTMSDVNANLFVYNNLLFAIDSKANNISNTKDKDRLRIVFDRSDFKPEKVFNLIDKLFDVKVLFYSNQN